MYNVTLSKYLEWVIDFVKEFQTHSVNNKSLLSLYTDIQPLFTVHNT